VPVFVLNAPVAGTSFCITIGSTPITPSIRGRSPPLASAYLKRSLDDSGKSGDQFELPNRRASGIPCRYHASRGSGMSMTFRLRSIS
jgi:hypothetical protein